MIKGGLAVEFHFQRVDAAEQAGDGFAYRVGNQVRCGQGAPSRFGVCFPVFSVFFVMGAVCLGFGCERLGRVFRLAPVGHDVR
ncbi:MAG TPA: hypothetical protein PKE57_08625, partial [Cellvibrionaceae bacterium]|nr:hypothetical protein [Cellvibrionaceae bacterium]